MLCRDTGSQLSSLSRNIYKTESSARGLSCAFGCYDLAVQESQKSSDNGEFCLQSRLIDYEKECLQCKLCESGLCAELFRFFGHAGLLDNLRELPGREALRLRAEVHSDTSSISNMLL